MSTTAISPRRRAPRGKTLLPTLFFSSHSPPLYYRSRAAGFIELSGSGDGNVSNAQEAEAEADVPQLRQTLC